MTRRPSASIVANPVLVGAVTTLVIVVAVFLAYNANNGLPFVPTREILVDADSGSNLVKGNEVREGGYRIGVVVNITPKTLPSGQTIAELALKLDKTVGDIPADSRVTIRARSALGLKYVEFTRGSSHKYLQDGDTIPLAQSTVPVQFDDIFKIFDEPTREGAQAALNTFGGAFAGRGTSVNQLIVELKPLLGYLPPVARNLVDPSTQLVRFFRELDDFVRIVAPIADVQARQFTDAATTFEAFSRDPQALRDTIAKSPPTLIVGTRSLRAQRPFLHDLVLLSRDLRPAARDLRIMLPTITDALKTGIPVLRRSVQLNYDVRKTLGVVKDVTETPTTNQALRAVDDTVHILNPLLRFLGPYQTVCDYWNYFWTFLGEHITADDITGTAQRANLNAAPAGVNSLGTMHAYQPVNGETTAAQQLQNEAQGADAAILHAQNYWAAVDDQGNADCENGQRGYLAGPLTPYLDQIKDGLGNKFLVVGAPHTPNDQGPTFQRFTGSPSKPTGNLGRNHVPDGETFSREPQSPAEAQLSPVATTGIYSG
jgi:virulence factor Mce-like protein